MSSYSNDNKKAFAAPDGKYKRQVSDFRDVIEKGGKFEPEIGRYKLIVSYACPWAHRMLIVRKLKKMDQVPDLLPLTVVNTFLGAKGWSLEDPDTDRKNIRGTGNNIPGREKWHFLREFYLAADPNYEQRPTVPVLWDNKLGTIVSNESAEMIRFMNNCFDEFLPEDVRGVTYYPEELRPEIDDFHSWVYPNINNGVYRAGFATTEEAYAEAAEQVFEALDRADALLKGKRYVLGDRLTEADIRLYTTIVRFDPVYFGHFKCNIAEMRSPRFTNLHNWLRKLYWLEPAFNETTDFASIKAHYYASHILINPTSIVPIGPLPPIMPLDK